MWWMKLGIIVSALNAGQVPAVKRQPSPVRSRHKWNPAAAATLAPFALSVGFQIVDCSCSNGYCISDGSI